MTPERRAGSRRSEDLRLQKVERQFLAAQRLCQSFFQHLNLDELMEHVLLVALEATGARAGSVLLADPETRRLVFRHVVGDRAQVLQGTSFAWHQGIAGAVFQSGQPELVPEVEKDPRHFHDVDRLAKYETHDMITLPVKSWEGAPIGVLNVLNKVDGPLNEDDLGLLTIMSAFAALAIRQAQACEQEKKAEVVDLLGNIGHDLKNMMQPLISGTELLGDEVREVIDRLSGTDRDASQKSRLLCDEMIAMVTHTSHRIQDRVKQIADCVKGLSGPPQFKAVRITDIVHGVASTLRPVALEQGLSLQMEGLDSLPAILADEHRLFNAFYNLIHNAIPETPRGGSITVGGQSAPEGGAVLLWVQDTGRGMSSDIRDRLFTPRAVSTKKGGTGLGLKIVKDVMDAHHGKVWVTSEPGAGTTFHLRFPLDPQKPPVASST